MLFQINNGYKCQKESLGSNKKRFSFIVYPQWCPFHRHCYHKNTQYIQVTKVHLNKKCCTHQSLIKTWNLFTFFLSEWRKRDNEFEGIKQVGFFMCKVLRQSIYVKHLNPIFGIRRNSIMQCYKPEQVNILWIKQSISGYIQGDISLSTEVQLLFSSNFEMTCTNQKC